MFIVIIFFFSLKLKVFHPISSIHSYVVKNMKFIDKLKQTGRRACVAKFILLCSMIILLMKIVKSLYFLFGSFNFELANKTQVLIGDIIQYSYIFPIDNLWDIIDYPKLNELKSLSDIISFYSSVGIPIIMMVVCTFFIKEHNRLKIKYLELKDTIEKDIALKEMKRAAGIDTVTENTTVDIIIKNVQNNDPSWHNTVFGQVIIGVAIAAIIATLGLK